MPKSTSIISFSGIDGAGKSTQIAALTHWLVEEGLKVRCLTFWDDVAMFSRLREFLSRKAFQGEQGIGSPEKPLHRRDKNVNSWPVTVARLFLYLADSLRLRVTARRLKRCGADVAIFDRYIYDELANLPSDNWLSRAFCRLMLRISPEPDIALLIDADPKRARERKPEYPLEFVHRNRNAYLALKQIAREIVVIEPLGIEHAETRIREAVLTKLSQSEPELVTLPQLD